MSHLYIVGLPHTKLDDFTYSACAFTAKTVRWTRILQKIDQDFTVFWGGSEAAENLGENEFISCLNDEEQELFFGKWDAGVLPVVEWQASLPYWRIFHDRIADTLRKRIRPGDMIAIVGGAISQEIVDEFKNYICIEPGVGYEGICQGTFACFESYAWLHHTYGRYGIHDGRYFDTVIPNSYEPGDFYVGESEDYALFVGRLIARKSPDVAGLIAKELGIPLKVAGAGMQRIEGDKIIATDGTVIEGEYVGSVNPAERASLMAGAKLFICPTRYIGPFEGVHVESMFSGVMPIGPDYGVFTETLDEAFRFRNLQEAVKAAEAAMRVNSTERRRELTRAMAVGRFSLDAASVLYHQWFYNLSKLTKKGWYEL